MTKSINQTGFTLVELLVYISLISLMLVTLSSFLIYTFNFEKRSQLINEIDQQGLAIIHLINQTILNAETINWPVVGLTATSLSLTVAEANLSPTVFSLTDQDILLSQGLGLPLVLNNSRAKLSNLIFANYSQTATPGIIKVEFTLSYSDHQFNFSRNFYGTASLR